MPDESANKHLSFWIDTAPRTDYPAMAGDVSVTRPPLLWCHYPWHPKQPHTKTTAAASTGTLVGTCIHVNA